MISGLTFQLKMVWGKIEAVKTEVNVPHLHVNETGTITVELLAPTKPGESAVVGLILRRSLSGITAVHCV